MEKKDQEAYLTTLIACLVNTSPQHTFLLITDATTAIQTYINTGLLLVPPVKTYFGLRRWYQKTLPALLIKEKIDCLLTINGGHINTTTPQLALITSAKAPLNVCTSWLSFLYKTYLAKSLQKVQHIVTIATPQHPELEKIFGVKRSQLLTAGYAVPAAYQPADWQQRETFLQTQTGGREYFLYTGTFNENDFLTLLKAFSFFKKRQKSNMQLLAIGRFTVSKSLQEKLDTYKYRQDVRLLHNMNNDLLPQFTACAYATLFIQENATVAYPVAAAIQCAVPVIGLANNTATSEIAGPAALYAQATPESLAEQMKLVYKDETLRLNLVYSTQQQAQRTDGRHTAQHILKLLTTSAGL